MRKELVAEILDALIDCMYKGDPADIYDLYAREDVLDALSIAKIKVGK